MASTPGNADEEAVSINKVCPCARPTPGETDPPTPSLFTRMLTRWPVAVALFIGVVIVGFIAGVGIPEFQTGFNGYDARMSIESRVADGFEHAREQALDYMRGAGGDKEEKVTGLKFEPLTQEEGSYRTLFFFHSASGDIFSAANLVSVMNVLNGATDILTTDFCYKGDAGGDQCQPPFTLMEVLKTYDSGKLKDMTKVINDGKMPGMSPGILKRFIGTDADFEKGTAAWTQGHVLMGAPLQGYHNLSHFEREQQDKRNTMFQQRGFLGPEPLTDGWIAKIDALIAKEHQANPDVSVYYGGKLFFPRIFGYVNIDIQYAIVSLFLVATFMWVQLGSVFLTCTG